MHMVKIVVIVGLVSLSSCSTLRGLRGGAPGGEASVQQSEPVLEVSATAEESKAQLITLVQEHIDEVEVDSRNNQDRIVRKRPYFFKEYGQYSGSARDAEIEITETESRTAPFIADVVLDRTRFATRYHRTRDEARQDDSFLRDMGSETLTYELRNGRWTRVGGFFLAESTEEQVNGEWVPVQRVLQRTLETEEPEKGWFGRTVSRITGKN